MRSAAMCWLFLSGVLAGQTATEWIQQGVEAYKAAQYDEAIDSFKQAVIGEPKSLRAHLYLATAYLADLYTTGSRSDDKTRRAQQEFASVLELDPNNLAALSSLMTLSLQQANAAGAVEKPRLLEDSREWCTKVLAVDPKNKEAHYTIGVIQWSKFYPAYQAARARLGLKAEDPGPFKDAKLRVALRNEWGLTLQDAIDHFERALDLDPHYDAAMTYMNLVIRQRADLADNAYAYQAEIVKAEVWAKKAIATKREKDLAAGPTTPFSLAPPPLPVVSR